MKKVNFFIQVLGPINGAISKHLLAAMAAILLSTMTK